MDMAANPGGTWAKQLCAREISAYYLQNTAWTIPELIFEKRSRFPLP